MPNSTFDSNEALHDDHEYYFNEDHFSTLVVNSVDFAEKNKQEIGNLVSLLVTRELENKKLALEILKKQDGREMLLYAISSSEFIQFRPLLISACWESGLDFTPYLEFFVQLILSGDYGICMEAGTVIECMEGKINDSVKQLCHSKLVEFVSKHPTKKELLQTVIEFLA